MMQIILRIWRSPHPASRQSGNSLTERALRIAVNNCHLITMPDAVRAVVCVDGRHIFQFVNDAGVIDLLVFRRLVVYMRFAINIKTLQYLMELAATVHDTHLQASESVGGA